MIIHSKDHDYYDTASGWYSDMHWQRSETIREDIDQGLLRSTWSAHANLNLFDDDIVFVVGFCGTLYHGIAHSNVNTLKRTFTYREIPGLNVINMHKYFAKYPVFIIEEWRWSKSKLYINPILKDWEFYKVKDAFTAHQEIEQYLTNELASQQDGLQLAETEAQILERHGFTKCTFKGKYTGRKKK